MLLDKYGYPILLIKFLPTISKKFDNSCFIEVNVDKIACCKDLHLGFAASTVKLLIIAFIFYIFTIDFL